MKHFAKFAVFLALAGMMLAAVMLAWPQRARAATAVTLDTVYKYKIVNEKSGLVLGIHSPQTTAGSNALQWSDNGSADHLWHFLPMNNGNYKILNMNSGEILGISAASTAAGASVLQWADNGTNDHLWQFIAVGSYYEILNVNSNLALDVSGASTSSGASIVQEPYTGTTDQLWKLVSTGAAAYVGPGTVAGAVTVHDPSMVKTSSGVYYVFSTSLTTPYAGIEERQSSDRTNFTNAGDAFSSLPSWVSTYNGGNGQMWAPDVSYHNGTYYMYYAVSSFGSQVSALGLATSSSAAPGSWVDHGVVFSSSSGAAYNAIDPGLTVDTSGQWWLSFGSYWTGIYMIQLNPSTGKQLSSNTTVYHLAERLVTSQGLEGAYIYYHSGYYYLFASIDACCAANATYHIMVGRSTSINGTYTDEGGLSLLNGGGTILLSTHGNIVGPGGQSVMTDSDGSLLVYHYYNANNNGSPTLGLNLLGWSSSGWPYVK